MSACQTKKQVSTTAGESKPWQTFSAKVRQAGTSNPLLQCCSACIWTHLSSGNKTQRNYKGLKITLHMRRGGKFWTTRYKEIKKPNCHFWRARSKKRCQEQKQGTGHAPCTPHHQRGEQNTSATPLTRSLDTCLPSPHIRNQLSPNLGSEQGKLLLVLGPLCCSRSPQ